MNLTGIVFRKQWKRLQGSRQNISLRYIVSAAGVNWGLVSIIYSILFVSVPGSAFFNPQTSSLLKITLAAKELMISAVAIVVITGLTGAVNSLSHSFWRSLGRLLLLSCLLILLISYCAEWYALISTGQFAGIEGIRMFMVNPRQILEHAAQTDYAALRLFPVIFVLSCVFIFRLLPGLRRFLVKKFGICINYAFYLILAGCAAGVQQISSSDSVFAEADPEYGLADIVRELEVTRTGPALKWVADIRRYWLMPLPFAEPADVEVQYKAQISLQDYSARVEPAGFRPLNVLLILVESLRADQLVSFGGKRDVMPNVDRLAEQGLIFTRHYTQASHSNYADICPLSSHYPLRNPYYSAYPKNPPYPRVLIYDVLKALGYKTAIISSQNENWGKMLNYLNTPGLDYLLHSENYNGPTYVPRQGSDAGFESFVWHGRRAGKIDDRFTVTEVLRWLESVSSNPFFLYVNLQNSHVPYEIPADFKRHFSPASLDFTIRFGSYPPEKIQVVKDVYADSLRYVDHQIGRIISMLETTGRIDNTLIIITGDTGQAFYEHGFASHGSAIYDEVMRVPLIISGGNLKSGAEDRLSEHIDLPPTVLHILGLPPHPSFQGRNLLKEDQQETPISVYLLAQTTLAHQYGIISGDYKLIYDERHSSIRTFNLRTDPGETRDLTREQSSLAEKLFRRLLAWRKHQLSYYSSQDLMDKYYPPLIFDRQNSPLP